MDLNLDTSGVLMELEGPEIHLNLDTFGVISPRTCNLSRLESIKLPKRELELATSGA
jgi:hypothetical protein